jgi:hypothetical protein
MEPEIGCPGATKLVNYMKYVSGWPLEYGESLLSWNGNSGFELSEFSIGFSGSTAKFAFMEGPCGTK